MEAAAMACGPLVQPSKDSDEADRSKLVTVLQRRLNTVDEAVWSVMAMRTRWRSSCAVSHYVIQYLLVSAYDPPSPLVPYMNNC